MALTPTLYLQQAVEEELGRRAFTVLCILFCTTFSFFFENMFGHVEFQVCHRCHTVKKKKDWKFKNPNKIK